MSRKAMVVALSFIWVAAAWAQEPLPFRGPAAERIEQYKKIRMMELLKLEEETSIRFFARYNRYHDGLREVGNRRDALIDELQLMRRRNATDADYQKVLKDLRGLVTPTVELREKYFDDLGKILTPKQFAEYLIFERNFVNNLREIIRDMQQDRMQQRKGMR